MRPLIIPETVVTVTLQVSQHAGWTVVRLPEELDFENAWDIRTELLRVLHASDGQVVLDLTGTTFIDSSGLWAIAATHRRAPALRGELRLVVTRSIARRLLRVTAIDRQIATFDDLGAALEAPPVPAARPFAHTGSR